MAHGATVREQLIRALEADLVGPFDPDRDQSPEILERPPSTWYLTGFLAPEGDLDVGDPEQDDEHGAGPDTDEEEGTGQEPEARRPKFFPASIGLSVFLPPKLTSSLTATLRYADYDIQDQPEEEDRSRKAWVRVNQSPVRVDVPLDAEKLEAGIACPGTNGLVLVGKLGPVDAPGVETGTRALALFVVNRRAAVDTYRDRSFVFQVSLQLDLEDGFVPRPDLSKEGSDEWDDRVSDLQYRDRNEYAVGHGVSVDVSDGSPVTRIRTTWLPRAEVRRVVTHEEPGVVVSMAQLAALKGADAIDAALSALPDAYGAWLDRQARHDVGSAKRKATRDELVRRGRTARDRIRAGIDVLESDADALIAFRVANRAMADAALRRNPERYTDSAEPEWRLFQLAFVLLNVRGIVDGTHADRRAVELIFFPTGGGKTEAYLGVIAFTLVLRRLRGRERADGGHGVAVLLRYTLRLLTLDQLGRAATLMCALEQLRKKMPERLGDVRFAVGLWVGRSATSNTMKDVSRKIVEYRNSPSKSATSPFPLPTCPWCQSALTRDSLVLRPNPTKPEEVVVGCMNPACDFTAAKNPEGLPVLFVDEQVYRELPAFIVATVDKFAMMPWRGETGMLFGRASSRSGRLFYGPLDKKKGEVSLPEGLRPPELIVQDELHLISGPLGTMVGLYEAAIEALCMHRDGDAVVRPKIIAATATVRRASQQVQALFARTETAVFPPPGPNASDNYFARTDADSPGRLYVGVGASGRALKAILRRVYVSVLAAAQKQYARGDRSAADAYMTLVGYFNSLRELGGMRRIVEDEVVSLVAQAEDRRPVNQKTHLWHASRDHVREPVELTSRESTGQIATSRDRLGRPHSDKEHVDVLLASNMISVGIDIDRLGLMVIAGQPKTTSEYIQASSRVGRDAARPGLVVTCLNVHKPRDRSHYERFTAYHESFYRSVEAMSLTPFSGRALERGLAGTFVSMCRLLDPSLTPPAGAMGIEGGSATTATAIERLRERAGVQLQVGERDGELAEVLAKRAQNLLDAWTKLVSDTREAASVLSYSRFDKEKVGKHLLHMPLDENAPPRGSDEAKFVAGTSMRDVEPVVHLWLTKSRLGAKADG